MYEAELNFLKKLLAQYHLNVHLIDSAYKAGEKIDLGLRKFLGLEDDYEKSFHAIVQRTKPNTIYNISDDFFCNYIILLLPDHTLSEKRFLVIGPYTEQDFTKQDIFKAIEKYQVPPNLTEYVNRKRIEYGVLLLNTTNMQIQTIAQHCGISDINYFTRIFKKQIGKTPKEYRNSIGR